MYIIKIDHKNINNTRAIDKFLRSLGYSWSNDSENTLNTVLTFKKLGAKGLIVRIEDRRIGWCGSAYINIHKNKVVSASKLLSFVVIDYYNNKKQI